MKDLIPLPSRKNPFNSGKGHSDSFWDRLRYIGRSTYIKYLFQHTFLIPIKKLFCPLISTLLWPISFSKVFFFFCLHKLLNFLFPDCLFLFFLNLSFHIYDAYYHSPQFNSICANYPGFKTEWIGLLEFLLHFQLWAFTGNCLILIW